MPDHPHDYGLQHDLRLLQAQQLRRRQALRWLSGIGAAGALPLIGCGGGGGGDSLGTTTTGSSSSTSSSTTTTTTTTTTSSCPAADIPTETMGPYPADGGSASGQTLNALTLAGITRSDIRTSVGSASGTAVGVPTTVTLTLVDRNGTTCAPLAGYAIYLWHCTRDGDYSLYSSGVTGENYLRGVQVTDANGQVTFTTIFPGCYSGRWPHIHFEVYPSLSAATDSTSVRDYTKVSQLAVPAAACNQVYGVATGYDASVANFSAITLASDNVFGSDSAAYQVASASGDVSNGFALSLVVGVSV